MSTLVLLGVADESTAHEGFVQVHQLHSVALLTLRGLAVLTTDTAGTTSVVETPPDNVGVEHVEVSPAFPSLLAALTGGMSTQTDSALPDDTIVPARHMLRPGRSTVVYLADDIAEGEVGRQLEFLNAERLSLTISPDDIEALTPTK